jgi:hypothetical protein
VEDALKRCCSFIACKLCGVTLLTVIQFDCIETIQVAPVGAREACALDTLFVAVIIVNITAGARGLRKLMQDYRLIVEFHVCIVQLPA